jgi:hypothetical protein
MALAFPMRAEAEPMSVRCDGQHFRETHPYFVTFDIEKSRFVFERAGGNIVTGEIISANDEQLDLSLRAPEDASFFPSIESAKLLLGLDCLPESWDGSQCTTPVLELLAERCFPHSISRSSLIRNFATPSMPFRSVVRATTARFLSLWIASQELSW